MKKTKILTVLSVLLAMGLTACNQPKSSEPEPSSEPPVVSSSVEPSSSVAPSSSQAPVEVPDPSGHKWGADADVAADATAGTVAYKKATCSDNDGATRLKVNQSVVTYADGSTRKDGTPEGYTKLTSNNQSFSFKFKSDKKYVANLYLYGCMDGWGSSSNHSAGFYYQNQPNVEIKLNDEVLDLSGSKSGSYAQWFGEDASDEDSSLSKEGYAPVGRVVINEGVNEVVYKRVQTLNMLIKNFVFIGFENEWGAAQDVAADATAGTVAYKKYVNNLDQSIKIEWKALDGTLAEGSTNKDGTPEGFLKLNTNGNSIDYKFNFNANLDGKIYQRGMMDSWSANKNTTYFSQSKGAKYGNFELKVNDSLVYIGDKRDVKYVDMLGDGDNAEVTGYSNVADCLIGEAFIKNGANTVSFKRVDSYNLAVSYFVFIGKAGNAHTNPAADAAYAGQDDNSHWQAVENDNFKFNRGEHQWIDDPDHPDEPATTCNGTGKHYLKCSVCGKQKIETIASTIPHTWTEKTAVKNSDNKDVVPVECSVCHKLGYQMNENDYSSGEFGAGDNAADALRPSQGKAIVYKIVVSAAGNYSLNFSMFCKSNDTVAMSQRGFSVKVNDVAATVTLDGTKTPKQLGMTSSVAVSVEMCASIPLNQGENTIAITCASYRLHYKGNLLVIAL